MSRRALANAEYDTRYERRSLVVNRVNIYSILGTLVVGLLVGATPLRAEPAGSQLVPVAGDPLVINGPDKPWSKGISIEKRAAAKELFSKGNELFMQMLFARAAERYTAALGMWRHPAIYFNLGIAQLNLGKDVEARESLEMALKYGQEPLGEKAYQVAQSQLQEVERQLGRIRVICRTPGAEVTLDGAKLFVGAGSYEGWVKAKTHDLTAKRDGYQVEARQVNVSAGDLQEIDLSLFTLIQATDMRRRWSPWVPWGVIGVGGAIAASGGVLFMLASRNVDAFDTDFASLSCAQTHGCSQAQLDNGPNQQLALGRRQQVMAQGAYILGGSLIATGVVLLYLNRPRLTEGPMRAPAKRLTVAPSISGEVLGVSMGLTY